MTTQITCSKPLIGIILFLSLAANVFLGGVLVGKGGLHEGGMGLGFRAGKAMEAFRELSPDSRDKARAAFKADWPDVKAQLKTVREKRDAVKQILMKKEYSDEELDKALADVRAEVNTLLDKAQALGKNVLKNVTPEERQKLLQKLPRPPAE